MIPQQTQNNNNGSKISNIVSSSTNSFMKTYIQPLTAFFVLYPLERIQSVKQIQETYNKSQLKNQKDLFTRCTHYGIRSWYRGLAPFFIRTTGIYLCMSTSESIANEMKNRSPSQLISTEDRQILMKGKNKIAENISLGALKYGIISFGYGLLYPFEVIRMRMSSQIQYNKIYRSMGDCLRNMKKTEGKSMQILYRGFTLSLSHFLLQFTLVDYIFKNIKNQKLEESTVPLPSFMNSNSGISQFLIAFILSQALLYPLDSIKKIIQINGAIGHDNKFMRYRDVLQLHDKFKMYRGFGVRLTNGIAYFAVVSILEKYQEKTSIKY